MAKDPKHLKFAINVQTTIQPGVDPVAEALHIERLAREVLPVIRDLLA